MDITSIKNNIKEQIEKLNSGDSIDLKLVYPELLEEVIDKFEISDINGWQCDYWAENEQYEIFGTMYYATATITKK